MSDLTRLTAVDAARRIEGGSLTAEALTRAYLDRIAEREPTIGAWQHLDPKQALAAAQVLDRGSRRGPLHGIPVGVKDIMDTGDMPTTYGSRAYEGFQPRADAACVALTRAAGGLALRQTATTQVSAGAPRQNPHPPYIPPPPRRPSRR